jgi:hypothetical protein
LSLDLALDDAEQAIADAVAKFCAERCPEAVVRQTAGTLPRALWRELAELGVLALATPEGDGGARELCAALESLGAAVFPGPLAATFLATQVLDEKERLRVAQGDWIVSLGAPPLMPFAPAADCFLALAEGGIRRAQPRGAVEPVETLGGEPWGRVDLELGPALRADARAWRCTTSRWPPTRPQRGGALVRVTAAHARTRTAVRARDRRVPGGRPSARGCARAARSRGGARADRRARVGRECHRPARARRGRAPLRHARGARRRAHLSPAVRRARDHARRSGIPRVAPDPPARLAAARARGGARRAARTVGCVMTIDLRGALPGIRYERRPDGIAVITLDRPDRGNALAPNMQPVMRAIWSEVRDDDAVRVAVVTAAGERHFCTGFDVGEAESDDADTYFANRPLAEAVHWSPHQNRVWKPVLCAVQGLCVGGGPALRGRSGHRDRERERGVHGHARERRAGRGALENVGLAKAAAARLGAAHDAARPPLPDARARAYELGPRSTSWSRRRRRAARALAMPTDARQLAAGDGALEAGGLGQPRAGLFGALEQAWSLLRLHWSHPDFTRARAHSPRSAPPRWDPNPNARTDKK